MLVVMFFRFVFNVSSFPLIFFVVGVLGLFFLNCSSFPVSLFLLFCLFIARLLCVRCVCVELLWLLCLYLHVQCLFVGFNVFSANCHH